MGSVGSSIQFRFSRRSRWEPVPYTDAAIAIALYGTNYDLRIDGQVRLADRGAGA